MPTLSNQHVQRVVSSFTHQLHNLFGANLLGFYLYGSVSLGAYEEGISDIDFLAVLAQEMTPLQLIKLRRAYQTACEKDALAKTFEGNFILQNKLFLDNTVPCPQVYDGAFHVAAPRDWNAVTLYNLYHHGLSVKGPSPKSLLTPVTERDLIKTMLGNLLYLEQRMPYYAQHSLEYQVFGVLTLCRILYTVETGKITSKRQAAEYVLGKGEIVGVERTGTGSNGFGLTEPWLGIVRMALALLDRAVATTASKDMTNRVNLHSHSRQDKADFADQSVNDIRADFPIKDLADEDALVAFVRLVKGMTEEIVAGNKKWK
ncbi:aminoglycoside adenylyltransferase domain-containing protein [Brevibacillus dissolubilis]|uniref:aminoglycoside adenylyltransferase domain-containing protein n=1 Tax=Brevibacillus dissolubilis TaxID=1844116 RepID=UPI00159BC6D2|nr:aminoglycoside adenylyltransferase domain-containing protein [Brevibacillus dissolubilis]